MYYLVRDLVILDIIYVCYHHFAYIRILSKLLKYNVTRGGIIYLKNPKKQKINEKLRL